MTLQSTDPPGRRPRVLFLAPRHPNRPWRGDQVRAHHLSRQLADLTDVRLVCFGADDEEIDGVSVRTVRPTAAGRLVANLSRPSPAVPGQVRVFLDAGMTAAIRLEMARFRPDVLHVTMSRMGPYMREARHCHRHLDLMDSMKLNMATRADRSAAVAGAAFRLEARLVGRYEARLAAAADSVSVIAEADRRALGLDRAVVIPNGVELGEFPFSEPVDRPPVVLFFGNLGYFHNTMAVRFLTTEVMERLRGLVPAATLQLAGARPTRAIRQLAATRGAELIANPVEMVPVLHGAAVAAIPMLSGSGMKNKVLEAFSAGLPVVTNHLGIGGIDGAVPGTHFLLAEGPEETARSVGTLLGNPDERARLARAARKLVVERYSWRRQAEALLALYRWNP